MDRLAAIDRRKFALLVVDMQIGFCHEEGDLARRGQGEPLRAVVPMVGRLVSLAHELEIPAFWSRQEHFPDDAMRQAHLLETHLTKQRHSPCMVGTRDVLIEPSLAELMDPTDYVFVKHRASCFYDTTLETSLRMKGAQVLLVCGVTTNYCVDSTVRDAYARDFDLVVVGDCCAALHPDLHDATLRNVELYHGLVTELSDLEKALRQTVRS